MKSTIFTDTEIKMLVETLGSKFRICINKAGNVKVINDNEPIARSFYGITGRGFWVLYKYNDGTFIWRRNTGTGGIYPLNMKGRKFKDGKFIRYRNNETGKIYYGGYRPFNVDMSRFKSFNEALSYFVNYLYTYKGISL